MRVYLRFRSRNFGFLPGAVDILFVLTFCFNALTFSLFAFFSVMPKSPNANKQQSVGPHKRHTRHHTRRLYIKVEISRTESL